MAGLAENVTILMPKKKVGSQAASAEKVVFAFKDGKEVMIKE